MLEEILARTAAALRRHGVPSMVIGGQAVLLYGEPRLTRGIDVTLGVDSDRLPDILALLEEVPLRALPDDAAAFVAHTMVLPALHESTGVRVDLVFSFTPCERAAIARSRAVTLAGEDPGLGGVGAKAGSRVTGRRMKRKDRPKARTGPALEFPRAFPLKVVGRAGQAF